MAAPDRRIGAARCPLCGSKKASLGVSAKGLAYLTCNACNSQTFARSDRSDEALRRLHVPEPQAAPFPHPLNATEEDRAAIKQAADDRKAEAAKPPAPIPAPTPAPQPKARPSWGLGAFMP